VCRGLTDTEALTALDVPEMVTRGVLRLGLQISLRDSLEQTPLKTRQAVVEGVVNSKMLMEPMLKTGVLDTNEADLCEGRFFIPVPKIRMKPGVQVEIELASANQSDGRGVGVAVELKRAPDSIESARNKRAIQSSLGWESLGLHRPKTSQRQVIRLARLARVRWRLGALRRRDLAERRSLKRTGI
jgi:hypothetical protein